MLAGIEHVGNELKMNASRTCIKYIKDAHVDLARHLNIEHGGSMKTSKTARYVWWLLDAGSDLAILVLCGPVVGAR